MLNEKANKFANFQSKIAVVNKLLGSCEDRTACHDPVREIIADFHSIVVVVIVCKYLHSYRVVVAALTHLFKIKIHFLVPENASETVRRFVESLFITHTEAKLNTSGRLVESFTENDAVRTDIPYDLAIGCSPKSDIAIEIELMDREEWCMDLIFPHHRPYMNANK